MACSIKDQPHRPTKTLIPERRTGRQEPRPLPMTCDTCSRYSEMARPPSHAGGSQLRYATLLPAAARPLRGGVGCMTHGIIAGDRFECTASLPQRVEGVGMGGREWWGRGGKGVVGAGERDLMCRQGRGLKRTAIQTCMHSRKAWMKSVDAHVQYAKCGTWQDQSC